MKISDEWIEILLKISLSAGVLFVAFVLTQGCTTKPSTPEPVVPPVSIPSGVKAGWDQKRGGVAAHPEWTPILVAALDEHGKALLQSYPEGVCGDRKVFWVALLSELAWYESSYNPRSKYTEAFPDDKGNAQISAGLFQLSLDDGKYNKGCDFKTMEDVYDVKKNIFCAVFIADKWVGRHGVVTAGDDGKSARALAKYWGPMRKPEKRKAILAAGTRTCL